MNIKTTKGGVQYYQDWEDTDGSIVIMNARTIRRYCKLKSEEPKSDNYGVFFAFDNEQFNNGVKKLASRGFIKDKSEIVSAGCQMYGTESEIKRFLDFYHERNRRIKSECDPQEVYFFEWNNHEVMISMDDDEVMKLIVSIFGKKAAYDIERVYAATPVNILAPLTERDEHLGKFEHELLMLGRLKCDLNGFFNEGDCRYHRPDTLWGGNINEQVRAMRELYRKLPDDIKDASPLSCEQIEDYAKRLEEWACGEFAKAEYEPKPATPYEAYKDLSIEVGKCLYYRDDDDKLREPDHIWFSADMRRWRQDAKEVAGRAFTTYPGKNGTTLAPVLFFNDSTMLVQFHLDHLCDVSCRYEHKSYHVTLRDFYHE